MSALSLTERKARRRKPSVFQAWNAADNLPAEDRWTTFARHDLAWVTAQQLGLRWDSPHTGLASEFAPDTVEHARQLRRGVQDLNPNLILLVEIRYRDASPGWLPSGHAWWKRDAVGRLVPGWDEGQFLQVDFANPECAARLAARAGAALQSGIFDGVLLDWWQDDPDRLRLVQAVRQAVGDEAAILVNTNDRTTPQTTPWVNGYFMECTVTDRPEKWRQIEQTLLWAEAHCRPPVLNCLETWYHTSRRDLHLMRATTALSLTHSDGYCLFSDPNPLPTPDHLHDWYPFWDRRLGAALSPAGAFRCRGVVMYESWNIGTPMPDEKNRAAARAFEGGIVIYNPMDNPALVIDFETDRRSVATGIMGRRHWMGPCDGDIFELSKKE
jgi:hypothetical protein